MEKFDIEQDLGAVIDVDDELPLVSDSDSEDTSPRRFAWKGLVQLEEDSSTHENVKKMFLSGMGRFRSDTKVVAIHQNLDLSSIGRARMNSFRLFADAVTKSRGGNGNMKYGWYGGSRDELCDILARGFTLRMPIVNGDKSHGLGVHLASANFAVDEALSCVADENDLMHMILCRVIMGNMEVIPAGSKQSHPSSKEFDSGVDSFTDPRKYVVWSSFMNSHIYPVYIVTFDSPSFKVFQGVRPKSPWMSFPDLISVLSESLHPDKLSLIVRCYNDFREKRIRRPKLIQKVREIAGDRLLIAVIESHRNTKHEERSVITREAKTA